MEDNKSCSTGCSGIMWWATLLVAVLAVPSIGAIVAFASQLHGVAGIVVFVLACWVSTYLGMKLMQNPKFSQKIGKKD
jgi:hypothetical protein